MFVVNLLGLLKWQEILDDTNALKWHLEELMHVDGEEIVKVCHIFFVSDFKLLAVSPSVESVK